MSNIFIQLAGVLGLSSLLGYFVHRLKLPLIVAYLLAGVLISVLLGLDAHKITVLEFLPEIGIAFVLFLIGMELDLREIRSLGMPIIIGSLGQIFISTIAGYAIAGFFGFTQTESIYLGFGLAFSSTVLVVKMLLEKRDLASLYGKLSIGILLLEDLVAIIVLMLMTVGNSLFNLGLQSSLPFLGLLLKGALLFFLTFIFSKYILERLFGAVAKSVELLFLTALTWCFIFTSLAIISGFSVVIGAFLAGVALANSPYHLQIEGKVKPLRDFFVTLFFVYLGAQVKLADLYSAWPAVIAFTAYALIVKPLIFLLILGIFGFRKHTLFQTSLNLSQISEFSLVILLVGVNSGAVASPALSVMALVGVLSIIVSSVLIAYSKRIYKTAAPIIKFFEHQTFTHSLEAKTPEEQKDHVVVIGAHRLGAPVIQYLAKEKIPLLVLDFNPHVIEKLNDKGINAIYGDLGDPEILEHLQLENAKLIISTATDLTDTEILLEECKRRRVRAYKVVRALDHEYVSDLKKLGADFVILPEKVSGDFIVNQIRHHWL